MSIIFAIRCLRYLSILCLLGKHVGQASPKATKSTPTTPSYLTTTKTASAAVRLVDGKNKMEGFVEIYMNNIWKRIYIVNLDFNIADMICRQLGYSYAMMADNESVYSKVASFYVHCPDTAIDDCRFDEIDDGFFTSRISCNTIRQPRDFDVRVIGQNFNFMGFVQVYYQGQWGYICDNRLTWDMREAAIVCKAMGFERALSDTCTVKELGRVNSPGYDSYPFIINNIVCTGSEILFKACVMSQGTSCIGRRASVLCNEKQLTDGEPIYDIRLGGGSNSLEGRVEIFIHGEWGFVCDDQWTIVEAFVVCRQLGFEYAISATKNSAFGAGEGEIKLDEVTCTGVEEDLILCSHPGAKYHNCDRSEQAGVKCSNETAPPIGSKIELKSCRRNQGHVQVYHNKILWRVCNNEWDDNDATVVCRQKNYQYGLAIRAPVDGRALYQSNNIAAYIDQVNCTGTEASLAECRLGVVKPFKCAYHNDAAVFCTNTFSEYLSEKEKVEKDSLPLRLTGSIQDNREGRVEVFANGSWWTMCSNQTIIYHPPSQIYTIASHLANVICRQLNFENAVAKYIELVHFDQSVNIQSYMGNLDCYGNETTLSQCSYQRLSPPYRCPEDHYPVLVACANYKACYQQDDIPTVFEPTGNFLKVIFILLFILLCGVSACVCGVFFWKCILSRPMLENWPFTRFRRQNHERSRSSELSRWLDRTSRTPEPSTTIYDPPHSEPPPPSYHNVIENPQHFPLYKSSLEGDGVRDNEEDEEDEPPPAYNYHGYDVNGDLNDATMEEDVHTTTC